MKRFLISSMTVICASILSNHFAVVPSRAQGSGPYPCSCVVSRSDLTFKTTAPGTEVLPPQLPLPNQAGQPECRNACAAASLIHYRSQVTADWACGNGTQNGTLVRSFARTGNLPLGHPLRNVYVPAELIGQLVYTPASSRDEDRCPPGWMSNTSNQPGDVTGDGRCKRIAGPIIINPPPDNGTQIGSWGFTWNDRIFAYGSAANGGAAVRQTIVTPRVCRLQ